MSRDVFNTKNSAHLYVKNKKLCVENVAPALLYIILYTVQCTLYSITKLMTVVKIIHGNKCYSIYIYIYIFTSNIFYLEFQRRVLDQP